MSAVPPARASCGWTDSWRIWRYATYNKNVKHFYYVVPSIMNHQLLMKKTKYQIRTCLPLAKVIKWKNTSWYKCITRRKIITRQINYNNVITGQWFFKVHFYFRHDYIFLTLIKSVFYKLGILSWFIFSVRFSMLTSQACTSIHQTQLSSMIIGDS